MDQVKEKTEAELLKEIDELKPQIRHLRIAKNTFALIEYGTLAVATSFGVTSGNVLPFWLFPILASGIYGCLFANRYHYLKGQQEELQIQYVLKRMNDASNKRK